MFGRDRKDSKKGTSGYSVFLAKKMVSLPASENDSEQLESDKGNR